MTLGPHKLPETWRCGPIHWKLVDVNAPAGADDLAQRTFASITAASGMTFVEDTPLSKLPGRFDDTDYNGIAVAWVPKSTFDTEVSESDAIGVGGPEVGSSGHYEHGTAWLLADWPDNQRLDFGSADAGHVLSHELGHALGLDHVLNDPNAVMAPAAGESTNGTHWSTSEKKALRYLHAACGIQP